MNRLPPSPLIRLLTPGLILFFSGCAYLSDRGRDFTDCWTVAVESGGVNAAVKLGPLATLGLGMQIGQGAGLRSGAVGIYETSEAHLILFGGREFVPDEAARARGKGYSYSYLYPIWPQREKEMEIDMLEGENFNQGQIEIAVNLGIGFRLGFNLAEMADFLLGWFGLDLLQDDAPATQARREKWAEQQETLRRIRPEPGEEKK